MRPGDRVPSSTVRSILAPLAFIFLVAALALESGRPQPRMGRRRNRLARHPDETARPLPGQLRHRAFPPGTRAPGRSRSLPFRSGPLRLEPGLAAAHFNLALAYWKLGRASEARRQLAETLRLQPHSKPARGAWRTFGFGE